MRIGIDARFYGITGIGRYVKNLITELEKLDQKNEYVIFLSKKNFNWYQPQNIRFQKVLADCSWYSFKEQLFMPFIIARQKIDLMHFPNFNIPIFWPGRFVVTIHDLIHQEYSTAKSTTRIKPVYLVKKIVYSLTIRWTSWKAKAILVPSSDTKKDVLEHLRVNQEKIFITYEGLDEKLFLKTNLNETEETAILRHYQIYKPYLLYVATMYPHKNHQRLIEAFKSLIESSSQKTLPSDIKLVLVGKADTFAKRLHRQVEEFGLSSRIIFPGLTAQDGYTPDEHLAIMYKHSIAYIFPSLKEGFGIPILEAQAYHVPVTCSDQSCLPEIAGNSALYFNPYSIKDMANKIHTIINDKQLRNDIVKKGLLNLKRFSWRKMAEETLQVYNEVVKLP
ncbi:glycosyltransferase family 4 protein [Patescibacteria group bacterium]|nr:glycosyltransferase family 4 protein [Patescibacteria group bacterium]MBU1868159.1 glycosyltransferase family 4 protein [Patescibacteria group bacterium]